MNIVTPKASTNQGGPAPVLDMEKIKMLRLENAKEAYHDQWTDIYALKTGKQSGVLRFGLWLIVLMLVCFIAWAYVFELDEITSATGKVVPTSREQVIQRSEPGVITEILV